MRYPDPLSWCIANDDALDLGARILADAATLYTQRLFTEYLTSSSTSRKSSSRRFATS